MYLLENTEKSYKHYTSLRLTSSKEFQHTHTLESLRIYN
jgi:hypothetical protein